MQYFEWNVEKNERLKIERNVSFEEIVVAIENRHVVDIVQHPNKELYPNQLIFYINIRDYIYAVPFVDDNDKIFLKTIFPDRKATKKYLKGKR